jgi:Rrf2 family iron-sulfur cluster assembly transcriptional regulator
LIALLHLADQPDATPVRGADIARTLDAPANYLSKLLHQLARAGVLHSVRGPQGGFCLAVPADELSLAQALAPIEAERLTPRCLLGRTACRDDDPCAAHARWQSLSQHIDRFLEETTLASLVLDEARERRVPQAKRKKTRRSR